MTNSIVYVSDGDAGGLTKGKLAPLVQGQSGQSITIEVRDLGNNLVNLTGYSTITGRKRSSSGDVTSLVGTLTLSGTPTVAPQVTWVVDEDDTGESDYFTVILTLSNGVSTLKTFAANLYIQNDPEVNATPAAGTVGVTEAQAALLASLATTTGLAEFNGTGGRTTIVIQSFMRSLLAAATVIAARIGLLPSYTGNGTKVLAVNSGATDVEWVAQSDVAVDVSAITTTTGTPAQMVRVAGAGGLEYRSVAQVLADLRDSGALATPDIGVLVASIGANTFTGAQNLADNLLTRPVIKDYGETVNAIGSTGGGTQDIDLTLGNVVSATVDTSTTTFTFSNPSASGTACSFTLFLTNGGSQTVNWPASVDWAGATAPTLTAAGVDILTFTTIDGGTTWYGFAAGLDMS